MIELARSLLHPYLLVLLFLGWTLARAWRREPASRPRLRLALLAYGLLVLLSVPGVTFFALASLEWQNPPLDPDTDQTFGAVVVLGSAVHPPGPIRTRATLDHCGHDRALFGATLYLRGRAPLVVVSGGVPDPDTAIPLAEVMASEVARQGVPSGAILLESRSTTTHENAVECARLLEARGVRRVLLVTDAQHMPRALACFRKQGIEAVAAPCRVRTWGMAWKPTLLVPSPEGLEAFQEALHEWGQMLVYRLRNRI